MPPERRGTSSECEPYWSDMLNKEVKMVRTFDITPASSAPFIFIGAIGILLILLLGFLVFTGYSARNAKFEVSDQGLRIKGSIYGRFIPKEAIATESIQIVNLNTSSAYKPRLRANGAGLPG